MKGGHGIYIRAETSQGFLRPEPIQHPTQKPVSIMRWCIQKVKVPAGDTILDPYAGSGTTGVAAMFEGHKCILIEKDPKYCDVIRRRIEKADGREKGTLTAMHAEGLFSLEANP